MEQITATLNVTNCWVCEVSLMTKQWPRVRAKVTPEMLDYWNHGVQAPQDQRATSWQLETAIVGSNCLGCFCGCKFDRSLCNAICTSILRGNESDKPWRLSNNSTCAKDYNPCKNYTMLRLYWAVPANTAVIWHAPEGLFWICGDIL